MRTLPELIQAFVEATQPPSEALLAEFRNRSIRNLLAVAHALSDKLSQVNEDYGERLAEQYRAQDQPSLVLMQNLLKKLPMTLCRGPNPAHS
jgi:hypothetical protein